MMGITRVKICGIMNLEDALTAVETGADALGFVFAPSSRRVTPEKAKTIIDKLPPFVTPVGVFVDEDPQVVEELARFCSLGALQFHGNETPEYCSRFNHRQVIKAVRVKNGENLAGLENYRGYGLLLDTFVEGAVGGTGRTFDWSLVHKAKVFGPVILAGGLTPENVVQAITATRPYGVDVSSGVETHGVKDQYKIQKFVEEVRRYQDAAR